MKDRLVTIALSVAATYGLMKSGPERREGARRRPADRAEGADRLGHRDALGEGLRGPPDPAGLYARSLGDGPGGLWVRSRLIKGEIDDPFDDRFHALERDGSLRRAPGHISWNVWLDGAWRQMAIIQGEGLELSEVPRERWSGLTHPGRLRFQTFRPGHGEPLTDALIGQGMMSVGGGGYGGGGLPYPSEVLQLWGGAMQEATIPTPAAPTVVKDDGSGEHQYAIIAVGPQGRRTTASPRQPVPGTRDTSVGQRPRRGLLPRRP